MCQSLRVPVAQKAADSRKPIEVAVRWEYNVVSTPDSYGHFRGNSPGFRAPVPERVAQPNLLLDQEKQADA